MRCMSMAVKVQVEAGGQLNCRMAELAAVMRRGLKLEPHSGLSAIPTKTFGDGISSLRCRGAS